MIISLKGIITFSRNGFYKKVIIRHVYNDEFHYVPKQNEFKQQDFFVYVLGCVLSLTCSIAIKKYRLINWVCLIQKIHYILLITKHTICRSLYFTLFTNYPYASDMSSNLYVFYRQMYWNTSLTIKLWWWV